MLILVCKLIVVCRFLIEFASQYGGSLRYLFQTSLSFHNIGHHPLLVRLFHRILPAFGPTGTFRHSLCKGLNIGKGIVDPHQYSTRFLFPVEAAIPHCWPSGVFINSSPPKCNPDLVPWVYSQTLSMFLCSLILFKAVLYRSVYVPCPRCLYLFLFQGHLVR